MVTKQKVNVINYENVTKDQNRTGRDRRQSGVNISRQTYTTGIGGVSKTIFNLLNQVIKIKEISRKINNNNSIIHENQMVKRGGERRRYTIFLIEV